MNIIKTGKNNGEYEVRCKNNQRRFDSMIQDEEADEIYRATGSDRLYTIQRVRESNYSRLLSVSKQHQPSRFDVSNTTRTNITEYRYL